VPLPQLHAPATVVRQHDAALARNGSPPGRVPQRPSAACLVSDVSSAVLRWRLAHSLVRGASLQAGSCTAEMMAALLGEGWLDTAEVPHRT
jgi:hypothetical protein